jgi:hypothetical protein
MTRSITTKIRVGGLAEDAKLRMAPMASHRANWHDWSSHRSSKRHVREYHVTRREMTAILKDFDLMQPESVDEW